MSHIMEVEGVFSRLFKIEAPIESVYAFITDMDYILPRMPEVERVELLTDGRYRMFYSAEVASGHKMDVVFYIKLSLIHI